MRNKIIIIISVITFLNSFSQEKDLGIGLMFGEPSGISAKYWLSETQAFDAGLGYAFFGNNSHFSLHVDYLYHRYDIIQTKEVVPVYYGFGVRLRTGDEDSFGVRGVGGIAFHVQEIPIDVFLEFVPVFQLLPETKLKFDASIGCRYYFSIN
jgi:hypothetical protein